MQKIVYLDNAATTWPKPPCVIDAVVDAMKYKSGNPGRGAHKMADLAGELLYDTRKAAGEFFGCEPECVAFTLNATHALNLAIKGLAVRGGHILIDNYSHNAVYRPVMSLVKSGFCSAGIYDASGSDDDTINSIMQKIRRDTKIIVATHRSNITSKVLPIGKIGAMCRSLGIRFVVDASQSAGHLPIDMVRDNITALCMPGHKGLYGPMGCGMLISHPDVRYSTIIEGGAGINSLDTDMPDDLPERLEAGTVPLCAIAGMGAGIEFINNAGLDRIAHHEEHLARRFYERISRIGRIKIYGDGAADVMSFNIDGKTPTEVGKALAKSGVCVRCGYHCAPLAHKTLGSFEMGSVRVSFSYMNTTDDADVAADVIERACS